LRNKYRLFFGERVRSILDLLVLRLYNRLVVLEIEGELCAMRLQRCHNNQTGFALIELLQILVMLRLLAARVLQVQFDI